MADPEARTSTGVLRGVTEDGMAVFRGIPFAAPASGDRRFAAPAPVASWEGVRDATAFGDSPMQPATPWTSGLTTSEDCLTLNVWSAADGAPRPVLVWNYGGGFATGTSAVFDAGRLARETGAIVVTLNHRTGALGFATLTHRGLPEASDLGIRDVIAGLAWVRREIAAFGGDPDRVTVVGQSSGAFIAASLLGAPAATGLFRALVLISGGASRVVPQGQAEALGDQLLAALGASDARELCSGPADEIVRAQLAVGSHDIGLRNGPVPQSLGVVLDGDVVVRHPMAVLTGGGARDIAMLFVVTGAEVRDLRGPDEGFTPPTAEAIAAEIASWGVDLPRAGAIAARYRSEDLGVWRERVLTDYVYRLPAARAALAQNAAGGTAWLLQLDEPGGRPGGHSLPIPLLFGNAVPPDQRDLGDAFRAVVGRVVRGEDPGWRPFAGPAAEAMMSGSVDRAVPGVFAELLEQWEGVARP